MYSVLQKPRRKLDLTWDLLRNYVNKDIMVKANIQANGFHKVAGRRQYLGTLLLWSSVWKGFLKTSLVEG